MSNNSDFEFFKTHFMKVVEFNHNKTNPDWKRGILVGFSNDTYPEFINSDGAHFDTDQVRAIQEPKIIPWDFYTCPNILELGIKKKGEENKYEVYGVGQKCFHGLTLFCTGFKTWDALLKNYCQMDNSPCGVVEGGCDV